LLSSTWDRVRVRVRGRVRGRVRVRVRVRVGEQHLLLVVDELARARLRDVGRYREI